MGGRPLTLRDEPFGEAEAAAAASSKDEAMPKYWTEEAKENPVILNLPEGREFQEHLRVFVEYKYDSTWRPAGSQLILG